MEIFRKEGLKVPLEQIADRAGVGRATLYRNFPDREALLEATLQVTIDELAGKIQHWGDRSDTLFLAIRAMADRGLSASCFDFMVPLHRHDPAFTQRVRGSFESILFEPLTRAKAAGLVREDFALENVYLMIIMVAAGGLQDLEGDTVAGMSRALDLLARGYAPRK
jgi:AcrR family transcriptional regulator